MTFRKTAPSFIQEHSLACMWFIYQKRCMWRSYSSLYYHYTHLSPLRYWVQMGDGQWLSVVFSWQDNKNYKQYSENSDSLHEWKEKKRVSVKVTKAGEINRVHESWRTARDGMERHLEQRAGGWSVVSGRDDRGKDGKKRWHKLRNSEGGGGVN